MNHSVLQIHTLAGIRRARESGERRIEISGFDSPDVLAMLLTSSDHPESHVLVFATEDEAQRFHRSVVFFSSSWQVRHLPSFDVTPYSGLYPNPRTVADRVAWIHQVNSSNPFPPLYCDRRISFAAHYSATSSQCRHT